MERDRGGPAVGVEAHKSQKTDILFGWEMWKIPISAQALTEPKDIRTDRHHAHEIRMPCTVLSLQQACFPTTLKTLKTFREP